MKLSKDVESLLLDASKPGSFVPDEYDVGLADIMVDWRTAESADIGILGIPFDTAVSGRRGCRFGPESVRNALVFSDVYEPGIDVDLSTGFSVADFGNVDVLYTEVLGTHERVEKITTELFGLGLTPVIIGGDHSLAYPDIKGLMNNVDGKVGVINIDGHLDVRHSHHGEVSSGTPFRRLLEDTATPLDPANFVEFGINTWLNSKYYRDYCRDMGIRVIPAREIHLGGILPAIEEAIEIASKGTDAIFLSFDIDAIDLAHIPGTNAPNAGGLSSFQALEAVWRMGQHPKCRGMDIVEIAPSLDAANVSSIMGAALIMQFMGATRRRLENAV
ncbi:MAG: agmatinase [Spirochaetes bacterium]|jgi:formimidoylglutamase|nr:agmatinase [Spirochaetota bacterium]